jgi:hypothetical protein
MQKAERVGRFVWLTLLGSTALALAGCGGNSDSGTSSAATTPTSVADTGATSGSSSSSSSTSGSTTSATPPAASSNSSITFSWVPPTENSNGSPLTNLAGYKIHYGTAPEDYSQVVALNNPSLNRYVLDSLPSGTYYFAITAYNSAGVESTLSGEISATLN